MIKGVIFDMDGTLIDNQWAHTEAFVQWCRGRQVEFSEETLLKFYGMGNSEIFPAILNDSTLTDEQIVQFGEEKEALYREIYAPRAELIAGLTELFEELKSRGVKMAVASSAMAKNVDFIVDVLGIRDYFAVLTNSQMVKRAKPSPDVFLLAAERMGLEPEECFVFEDAFAGVEAARAAGMGVGVVTTTFARELHKDYDLIMSDFTEVTADLILGTLKR